MSSETPMPIAIVGMSCRLPGEVSTLDDFWVLLSRARSGWCEIPKDRFSADAYWHPNPEKKGCFNCAAGYFLKHDISKFDAPFFNITQQEAKVMDPQQRQLLECTYEALENAGIPKETIAGRNMGVFIGGSPSDYHITSMRDLDTVPMFDATGNHQSVLAGRISHYFDLHGPCLAIDTACSSSLHALHQAVQSIRSGDSEQAVVASSRLNLTPDHIISMSTSRLLSEHGKTFSFDNRAKSGFARGEGTGCLILKPLHQAIKDNDKVWSVIVNTGINQDGKTVGLTAPSVEAQEQLIRDVYARAGISPLDTGYVEAHGTGTKVGDPIEADAIHRVFSEGRSPRSPLYIGSVKSNVGHLEPASGIVAVIKASMMLNKGFILPNVNFQKGNEQIPFTEWNMKVPVNQRPWPKDKRFISVNNFGFGGSNAHCVLGKAPEPEPQATEPASSNRLFVMSANDEESAAEVSKALGIFLEQHPGVFEKQLIRNIAYTLCHRRSHLTWRAAVVADDTSSLAMALNGPEAKASRALRSPKIGFVFTGQGAQWHAMGRELMSSHEIFAASLRRADATLKAVGAPFSLLEELSRDKADSQVNSAHLSQPACTSIQLGLIDLLESWGIRPASVVGHSSGEIAAAYAAGAISHEDAVAAAYQRGQAVLNLKAQRADLSGAMLAVGCGRDEVLPLIKKLETGHCGIACENSPSSVTISGDATAVDELVVELEKKGVFNRKLMVDVAYHSTHMENVADAYFDSIQSMSASKANVSFYSSLHGAQMENTTDLDATYWVQNLTRPVLFNTALQELCATAKPDILVEIGPHSALEGPIKQILKTDASKKVTYLPSLKRNSDATKAMLTLAGNLFKYGLNLNFGNVNPDTLLPKPSLITDLKPYPWNSQKYWRESRISRMHRLKPFRRHDLLGTMSNVSNDMEPTWRNVLRTDDIPWLRDHKMQDLTTFPFSGYVSMAIEAASQRASMRGLKSERFTIREMQVNRPLIMHDGEDYEIIFSLRQYAEGTRSYSDKWDEFRVHSHHESRGWTEHGRGLVCSTATLEETNPVHNVSQSDEGANILEEAKQTCRNRLSAESFYDEIKGLGAGYGDVLRRIHSIAVDDKFESALGQVNVPDTAANMPEGYESPTIVHAVLLDLLLQSAFALLGAGRGIMPCLYMPSAVKEVQIDRSISALAGQLFQVVVHGEGDAATPKPRDMAIQAFLSDDLAAHKNTKPALVVKDCELNPIKDNSPAQLDAKKLCFKSNWISLESAKASETSGGANSEEKDVADVAIPNGHSTPNGDSGHEQALNEVPVVLLTQKNPEDSLIRALSHLIEGRTGSAPVIASLAEADTTEKVVINLYDLEDSLFMDITPQTFGEIKKTVLESLAHLWVTNGAFKNPKFPHRNMAQGFFRTIRSEMGKSAAIIDMNPNSSLNDSLKAELIMQAFDSITAQDHQCTEMEFAEEDGKLVVPRIEADPDMNVFVQRETQASVPSYMQPYEPQGRRLKLDIETAGALDTLYFKDDEDQPLHAEDVEICVEATGVNFKDVVISMGQLASPYIGVECSGTVSRVGSNVSSLAVGDRVCAMPGGAYRTYARCHATSAAKMPADMSMEVGASIPVVFCTAFYGLFDIARLAAGERILIHAAAGGVGQAAIQLAQMVGAEIYVTVGSVDKKQLIMDKYGIPEDHIFYSRNTEFGPAIREATGGEGVDVVLNSLAGDLLRETWDCVAHFGRFIEIGKRDITSNTRLEMRRFESNALFSSVDLTLLASERPKIMGRVMTDVMKLMSTGDVRPIYPVTVMGISELEKALRLLQGGKTTGKLVVAHRAGDLVRATHPRIQKSLFRSDGSYIILGGTGGLGRSMAKWMVLRGAGHVVLVSRGGKNTKVDELVSELGSLGSRISVKPCNITNSNAMSDLIKDCSQSLPPIRGVIHSTMVLRDMLFEKMGFEDYDAVVQSKVAGAWNVHNALSGFDLDFFVLLSSVAGIVGNTGQTAYAAANTFLDALASHRIQNGLPAAVIDLPAMDDVGYLAENSDRRGEVLKNLGDNTATEAELLALLDAALDPRQVPNSSDVGNSHILTGLHISDGSRPPYAASANDARFTALLASASTGLTDSQSSELAASSMSIQQTLSAASNVAEASEAVTKGLINKLSAILLVSAADVDPDVSVTAYGLDSLNAIELRNWIGKELLAHLQVLELLTSDTLRALGSLVLKKSRIQFKFKIDS